MKITTIPALMIALLLWLAGMQPLRANEQLLITVKLAVRMPPCTVNDGQPINVKFGDDLWLNKIEEAKYRQPIHYALSCANAPLKLAIIGEGASFNAQVLRTDQDDLGIQILSNGTGLALNQWQNFALDALPALEVVLVQRPGAKLKAGKFNASALLKVDYL